MQRLTGLLTCLAAVLSLSPPITGEVQVRPVYRTGAAGLVQSLGRLRTTASVLHTAAHPDDEDSTLIARLALGDHARVAYLSMTRGDGGQNIIGPELFEALGVIRTEELLQARTLDGGEQLFTRAFDFGFSKSRDEALSLWGEAVLGDVVRAIRLYRPLVIVSRFTGTPDDGHGQHQAAGALTIEAFRAAADPARFPEHLEEGLRPWQAKKLYVGEGFFPRPGAEPTLQVETGVYDPVIGRAYAEVAMEGRSQHKSQAMGVLEVRGPRSSGLRLVESLVEAPASETSLFDGLDVSVEGLASLVGLAPGRLERELAAIQRAADTASESLDVHAPAAIAPTLAEGLAAVRAARAALTGDASGRSDAEADADFLLAQAEREFADALVRASGLVIDALAREETVVAGSALDVDVRAYVASPELVSLDRPRVVVSPSWTIEPGEAQTTDSRNPFARFFRETPTLAEAFRVRVPASTPATQPYWLVIPRQGARFAWPDTAARNHPFAEPLLHGELPVRIAGAELLVTTPVEYRFADQTRGELRRDVAVVPAVTLAIAPTLEIVRARSAPDVLSVSVRVRNHAAGGTRGSLRVDAPDGWRAVPAEAQFGLDGSGQETAVTFEVTPPAGLREGAYRLTASARVNGTTFNRAESIVAYPHIRTHRLYEEAAATVHLVDLDVAPVSIGYVMGSGDLVPEAIRRLGLDVTLLSDGDLAGADLSRFDTIVVGIRASEARPAFVANHGRLMAYVEGGGTLIVQYQQTDYTARGLSPFPGELGSRVTDETAPITMLAPEHPRFTFPNRIRASDWDGWIQERNLYAFRTFDERYQPLVETHDPGEAPQRGGELYVELGRGRYVYTAYSWFRQLPAGVPGAYRLFANLLSLGRAPTTLPDPL